MSLPIEMRHDLERLKNLYFSGEDAEFPMDESEKGSTQKLQAPSKRKHEEIAEPQAPETLKRQRSALQSAETPSFSHSKQRTSIPWYLEDPPCVLGPESTTEDIVRRYAGVFSS